MKDKIFSLINKKTAAITIGFLLLLQVVGIPVASAQENFDQGRHFNQFHRPYYPWWYRYYPRPHYPQYFQRVQLTILTPQPITNQVQFRLTNTGNRTVNLPNSAPWYIVNNRGVVVFSPVAAQVITPLRPGESLNWSWDLRNNAGQRVAPGYYRVIFNQPGASASAWFYVR